MIQRLKSGSRSTRSTKSRWRSTSSRASSEGGAPLPAAAIASQDVDRHRLGQAQGAAVGVDQVLGRAEVRLQPPQRLAQRGAALLAARVAPEQRRDPLAALRAPGLQREVGEHRQRLAAGEHRLAAVDGQPHRAGGLQRDRKLELGRHHISAAWAPGASAAAGPGPGIGRRPGTQHLGHRQPVRRAGQVGDRHLVPERREPRHQPGEVRGRVRARRRRAGGEGGEALRVERRPRQRPAVALRRAALRQRGAAPSRARSPSAEARAPPRSPPRPGRRRLQPQRQPAPVGVAREGAGDRHPGRRGELDQRGRARRRGAGAQQGKLVRGRGGERRLGHARGGAVQPPAGGGVALDQLQEPRQRRRSAVRPGGGTEARRWRALPPLGRRRARQRHRRRGDGDRPVMCQVMRQGPGRPAALDPERIDRRVGRGVAGRRRGGHAEDLGRLPRELARRLGEAPPAAADRPAAAGAREVDESRRRPVRQPRHPVEPRRAPRRSHRRRPRRARRAAWRRCRTRWKPRMPGPSCATCPPLALAPPETLPYRASRRKTRRRRPGRLVRPCGVKPLHGFAIPQGRRGGRVPHQTTNLRALRCSCRGTSSPDSPRSRGASPRARGPTA